MKFESNKLGFIFAATILLSVQTDAACQGDMKIVTQNDLDQIRNCKTYGGNLIIDNSGASELKLTGVELLEGDLIVSNNDGLQSFSMPRLQGINGQLRFSNNKILNTIEAKQLYALRSLEVSVHPALNELKFAAGLSSAEKITITDTTCTKVEGFKMTSAKEIEITNNIYLKSLSLGTMTSVGKILISANAPSMKLDLNSIENIHDAAFRNVAHITLENLSKISQDISFISNTFESLELPAVTDITGTLTLTDNHNLSNLTLSKLSHLGGALSLNNNNKLATINGFPNLQQVDGTLDVTGAFDDVQLPSLIDVRGGLNVQTSSNFFTCDGMNKLKSGVIKGNSFTCKAAVAKPKSSISGKSGGSDKSGSSESSASTFTQSAAGMLAAVSAVFYMLHV